MPARPRRQTASLPLFASGFCGGKQLRRFATKPRDLLKPASMPARLSAGKGARRP
jgi:hypothetical protein